MESYSAEGLSQLGSEQPIEKTPQNYLPDVSLPEEEPSIVGFYGVSSNYGALPEQQEVYSDLLPSNNEEIHFVEEKPDPNNAVFNSFISVNRIPLGMLRIEKDPLGAGAFGQVYRGDWGDRTVALKKIDFEYAKRNLGLGKEEILESLSWEISRLSTVTHPNIVQFYGIYQHERESYTYLVMNFCEGGELRKRLKKEVEIPWSKRWQWALEISEAVAYLHSEGVLHRDLKAENILLDRHDRARLADLGVAQVDALLQESEAKIVAIGLQDKRFIAPENISNPALSSKATDIYALGLVLWEIASRKEPRKLDKFSTYEFQSWVKGSNIEREPIPEDCPESFKELILGCWQYEDKKRLTAEALITKLNQIGPQLNERCALIQNCQRLEKLIHPKRKEGLSYIPPFVTAHKVEEAIESYWGRFESPQEEEEEEEEQKNPPLKLDDTFKEFITTPGTNTLLLLGEAGLGKTLTTYLWADQLLSQWWAHINQGEPTPAYFPIFIRPSVPKWTHKVIGGSFLEVAQRYNLNDITPLVFVDGYDELQLDTQPTNLVNHLGMSRATNAKLIVTCRPSTVERSELEPRFNFNGNLATRYFLPFSVEQLLTYLKKELSWEEAMYNVYKKTLEDAQVVRTVLRNPFVLYLMRQSWETVSKKPLNRLNRWQIYEGFVEHTIETQKLLLSENLQKTLHGKHHDLLSSYQAFASDVALNAFQRYSITLGWEDAAKVSEWAHLKDHAQHEAQEEFAKRQAKLQEADEKQKDQISRRSLIKQEDYVNMMDKRRQQFESELPMKLRGEETEKRYEYSHKSLYEYFTAKRLILLKRSQTILEEATSLLKIRPIQEEEESLAFWEEGWGEEEVNLLKEPLFGIIQGSRQDPSIAQASANAATLLAAAHVPFSGRDLSGVRIQGADLSNAIFSYTRLYQADLQDAILHRAWLGNADLREANLNGIKFGEFPSLQFGSRVGCVSYSKDGKQMAVGLLDGNIMLYSQEEEACKLIITLKGHTGSVSSVNYSPDGKHLASGSSDKTVAIWETAGGQQVTLLKGHTDSVSSVTYSPDGKHLASGSYDTTIAIWDTASYQQVTLLKGHTNWVWSVTYSPDGKYLASGGSDKTVAIWDTAKHQQVTLLEGHTNWIASVSYSPDGKYLASGSGDRTIAIWDTASHQQVTLLKGHSSWVRSITYSPNGKHLASGSEDKTIAIWDTASHQQVTLLKGHTHWVGSVTYSPDGKLLVSGSGDKTVAIWDTASHQQVTQIKGHTDAVNIASYSPDGKYLATGSSDRTIAIWDTATYQQVAQLKGHTDWVNNLTYSPDGKHLASASDDKTVVVWDTATHQQVTQLNGHTSYTNSVTYSPDCKHLVSGSDDKTIVIWDTATYQQVAQLKGHTASIWSVTYSPDGKHLASGSLDQTIVIWDTASNQQVNLLKGHTNWVNTVTYSPDGKQLASACKDNTIAIWDTASNQQVTLLKGHTDNANCATYSLDGKQLASGSYDKTVGIWDTATYQQVTQLKGHTHWVNNVAFSPDSKHLVSCGWDHAIFLWAKQSPVYLPEGLEKWQLIRRLENSSSLSADGAFLKGAKISPNNLALLKQKGANDDQDIPDHPHES